MTARARSSLIEDLNHSVRENPAAAGLIGLGVAWMLFGRSNLATIGGYGPRAVKSAARAASSAAGSAARAASSAAGATARAVSEGADSAVSSVSGAAGAVMDNVSKATDDLGEKTADFFSHQGRQPQDAGFPSETGGHSMVSSLQRNLSEALDRQPILLGAIGLALGAGIASAIPSSKMERHLMGEKGAAFKDTMREMVDETVDEATIRIRHVSDRVKEEASTQASALKDQLSDTAEKLAAVAASAK